MEKIASATRLSKNAKIGRAAVTAAAQVSCPETCVFKNGGGCYAESGSQGNFVTHPLNEVAQACAATALDVARAEAVEIDALRSDRPLRLHSVGDCASDEAARIVSAAAERYMDRGAQPVWTYTHGWREVERASWGRVSVLASCETPLDALLARERGYAAAIVVDEFASDKRYEFESASVLPCPAQTRHRACSDCRLCFDDEKLKERNVTIGFAVHGDGYAVKKARLALSEPESKTRRLTSRDFVNGYLEREERWPSIQEVMRGADVTYGSAAEMLQRMRGAACT